MSANPSSVPIEDVANLSLNDKKEASPTPATPTPAADSPTPANGTAGTSIKAQFVLFSKFGDTKSDGKHITLSQSDKWMKQAKVGFFFLPLSYDVIKKEFEF